MRLGSSRSRSYRTSITHLCTLTCSGVMFTCWVTIEMPNNTLSKMSKTSLHTLCGKLFSDPTCFCKKATKLICLSLLKVPSYWSFLTWVMALTSFWLTGLTWMTSPFLKLCRFCGVVVNVVTDDMLLDCRFVVANGGVWCSSYYCYIIYNC